VASAGWKKNLLFQEKSEADPCLYVKSVTFALFTATSVEGSVGLLFTSSFVLLFTDLPPLQDMGSMIHVLRDPGAEVACRI
jgi:hypothetical protein